MSAEPVRVVVSGDLGRLARALRDEGVEVIFLGESATPQQVARAVLQEDADALVSTVGVPVEDVPVHVVDAATDPADVLARLSEPA